MKCPKCDYLGFETGDRCKNCGYDFSLLAAADTHEPDRDLLIRPAASDEAARVTPWLDELDRLFGAPAPDPSAPTIDLTERITIDPFVRPAPALAAAPSQAFAAKQVPATEATAPGDPQRRIAAPVDDVAPMPPPSFRGEPTVSRQSAHAAVGLPLFSPESDDEPLVKLPATPRPPLAVRRTPDRPRLRALPKPLAEAEPEPELTLQFADTEVRTAPPPGARTQPRAATTVNGEVSGAGRRVVAALVDQLILCGIDLVVVYFTLRLASLTLADWRALPAVPMVAFLAIVKVSYFSVFTAVGGQTIGKMAAGIRVITDERGLVDPARAVRRTLAGAVSFVTFGLAFIPALFGADKRALHDRLAHTRVVALPSGQF